MGGGGTNHHFSKMGLSIADMLHNMVRALTPQDLPITTKQCCRGQWKHHSFVTTLVHGCMMQSERSVLAKLGADTNLTISQLQL